MNTTSKWQQEWVIDADPLALANARHLPSGLGLTLRTSEYDEVPPGSKPFIAALYTEESQVVISRKFGELGHANGQAWLNEMYDQARELWRHFDPGSTAIKGDPPSCQVVSWRGQWNVVESGEAPHLAHSSGLVVWPRYAKGEDGVMRWALEESGGHAGKANSWEAQRLSQEAAILWMEAGYFDIARTPFQAPFGAGWRDLWRSTEEGGEKWLLHVSGIGFNPYFGVVEDDGLKAWSLYVRPGEAYDIYYRMHDKIGRKAWDRFHHQAWERCVELGYITPIQWDFET